MLLKETQMLIGILIETMRLRRRAIVNRALGLDRKASIPIAKKNRETTYTADPRIFSFSFFNPFLPSALF